MTITLDLDKAKAKLAKLTTQRNRKMKEVLTLLLRDKRAALEADPENDQLREDVSRMEFLSATKPENVKIIRGKFHGFDATVLRAVPGGAK
jgi:transcription antitermination factor NusG